MTRPTLFLDIDGVCHGRHARGSETLMHAPALADALRGSDCAIVISSTWRFFLTPAQLLARLPTDLASRVIGRTGEALSGYYARYREIRAWVDLNRITDYRCLDDSEHEFPQDCPHLIACDPGIGLTEPQLDQVRIWLSRPSV